LKALRLITILFFTFPNLLFAQVDNLTDVNIRNHEIVTVKNSRLTYSQLLGKPYLVDSFLRSKVFLKTKQIVEMDLRYDIYADEIEIWNNPKIYYLVKGGFDSIMMDNIKIVYVEYKLMSKTQSAYFIVVTAGQYCLLQKKNVEFCEEDAAMPYAETKPARFEKRPDIYYLMEGSNPAVQVSNKKLFKNTFPALFKNAEAFIKKENINFSKQNDLKLLINFLNAN